MRSDALSSRSDPERPLGARRSRPSLRIGERLRGPGPRPPRPLPTRPPTRRTPPPGLLLGRLPAFAPRLFRCGIRDARPRGPRLRDALGRSGVRARRRRECDAARSVGIRHRCGRDGFDRSGVSRGRLPPGRGRCARNRGRGRAARCRRGGVTALGLALASRGRDVRSGRCARGASDSARAGARCRIWVAPFGANRGLGWFRAGGCECVGRRFGDVTGGRRRRRVRRRCRRHGCRRHGWRCHGCRCRGCGRYGCRCR